MNQRKLLLMTASRFLVVKDTKRTYEVPKFAVRSARKQAQRCFLRAARRTELRSIDSRGRLSPHDQWTMLIAMTGVMEFGVFFPVGNRRKPAITPTLLLKLYSMAGAIANAWLGPELSKIVSLGFEMS